MSKKKSILVVDDVPEQLTVVGRMLTDKHFDVRLAKSAGVALDILKKIRVDLILLDIEMPEMSGFEFLRELQLKDTKNKNAPVVFVSSHASPSIVGNAINFKPKDYLLKPVTAEILYQKIDAIIGMPQEKDTPETAEYHPVLNEGIAYKKMPPAKTKVLEK